MNDQNARRLRWIMLALYALTLLWFYLLEVFVPAPRFFMHARLDDYIPFLPIFAIPYGLWYLYLPIPAAWLFFKRPEHGCRLLAFFAAGMAISCLVYTLLPNGIQLRPDTPGDGLLGAAIGLLYSIDPPTNSAPSLHVIQAIGVHGAIVRASAGGRRHRLASGASFVLLVLIILSTVFIKQHSVVDLAAGLLVGLALYFLFYGRTSPAFRRLRPATEQV